MSAADETAIQALSDAGAFCGVCGFQPGDRGCPDCERCWAGYVKALRAAGWAGRAEVTAEFVAWLVKRAREHRAQGPQYAKQADVIGMLASKVQRGAVRPNNLLMLPPQGGPEDVPALRARVAELEALAANGNGITYALAVITKHGDMSDEVRQEIRDLLPAEDPCRPCGCPKRFDRHADGCPTLPEATSMEAAERAAVDRSITDQFPATAVDKWNAQYPVGTPVFAYPGCRPEDDPKCTQLTTRTRSAASVLGGHTAVVWVEGHGACISLTHVYPRPETGGAS